MFTEENVLNILEKELIGKSVKIGTYPNFENVIIKKIFFDWAKNTDDRLLYAELENGKIIIVQN